MLNAAFLLPDAADRLVKLLGYLGSDHDGERAVAAKKADEFVRKLGLCWRDVIRVAVEWRALAERCCERMDELTPRECDFIKNILRMQHRTPTEKQMTWLSSIAERLEAAR